MLQGRSLGFVSPRVPNASQSQNLFVLSEQMDSAGRSRRCYNLISLVGSRNSAALLVCSQCRCLPTILSIQIFMRIPQRKWTQKRKCRDTNTFIQSKHFALPNKSHLRRLLTFLIYLFIFLRRIFPPARREERYLLLFFSIRKQFLWVWPSPNEC